MLCFAPTRSGKGVGLVVPTLLAWPDSAIVHDIKGENWTLTAGWRARLGRVLLFDPTNAGSAAYDPLLEVRRSEWEVRDVQRTCWSIPKARSRNEITGRRRAARCWSASSCMCCTPSHKTLAGVANADRVVQLRDGKIESDTSSMSAGDGCLP